MDQASTLPRGGFGRGVFGGMLFITITFLIFAGLFPMQPLQTRNFSTTKTEPVMPFQPVMMSGPEQFGVGAGADTPAIFAPTSITSPSVSAAAPVAFGVAGSGTAPAAASSAPVASVSIIAPVASLTPGTLAALGDSAPVVEVPEVLIEVPDEIASPVVNTDDQTSGVSVASSIPATTTQPVNMGAADATEATEQIASDESADKPEGGFDSTEQTIVSPTVTQDVADVSNTGSGPAFESYSLSFSNFGDEPLVSIILLAETVLQADAASSIGVPITLAVSADNPEASNIINHYRVTGGEVLVMLPSEGALSLRQGGDPAAVAEIINFALGEVIGVIGVIDGPDGDINKDMAMTDALLAELAKTGHALITTTTIGINNAESASDAAGVYATTVTRQLDASPGKITVIRAMDKAILELGTAATSTVFGTASEDTIAALAFWLKSQKAQTVTMAPVSAVILNR